MYYRIKDNKVYDYADYQYLKECLYTDLITQAELDEHPNKIIIADGVITLNPNYEQEEEQKEAERIANLHLTRGDVFRALFLAKGVTRADIRALIEAMPESTQQEKIVKEMAFIDFDEALEYYRGVDLINTLGAALHITKKQLDDFFETNDWQKLVGE